MFIGSVNKLNIHKDEIQIICRTHYDVMYKRVGYKLIKY